MADFGFSKILDYEEKNRLVLGSPLNMAPEILLGKEYDSKADIWSLGVCLYEIIYRKPPFIGKSLKELSEKI